MVEVQTVQIKSPVTLKPRIETVNSGRVDPDQTDCQSDGPADDDVGFEVNKTKSQTNSSNIPTNTTNRANHHDTITSNPVSVSQ